MRKVSSDPRILAAALLAVIFFPLTVLADWMKTYGGIGNDNGYCAQQTSDSGFIVTGCMELDTTSLFPVVLWILKTDASGNEEWSKIYGDTGQYIGPHMGYFVQQTADGGYIITGKHSFSGNRTWLLKTDPQGDTLWTRDYGISEGHCVQELKDGGYIVTGRTMWDDLSMFLLKTSSAGESLWMRTYLPEDWPYSNGRFVQETEDGGFIVAGSLDDPISDHWGSAFWLLKTDSLGDPLWTCIQGHDTTGEADAAYCVRQTSDKDYVAIGTVGLLKLDTQGDTIWSQSYAQGTSVIQTSDGGYVITGVGEIVPPGYSDSFLKNMAWLAKTNPAGDFLWKQVIVDGTCQFVEQTLDQGYVITGHRHINGGDLLLIWTDSLGYVGITEPPVTHQPSSETPVTPVTPHLEISSAINSEIVFCYCLNPSEQGTIKLFDASGRIIESVAVQGQGEAGGGRERRHPEDRDSEVETFKSPPRQGKGMRYPHPTLSRRERVSSPGWRN